MLTLAMKATVCIFFSDVCFNTMVQTYLNMETYHKISVAQTPDFLLKLFEWNVL